MSTRRSVSTTRLPQLDDPESIIRKANAAKRLAAKATVTQSQTPATSSTTPVITKEGPGPTHSDNPTTNLLIVPATNIPASLLPPIVNLVSIPTPDDDNPPILPRPVNPASIPLPIDNLPSPFLRPHEMQNTEVPAALGNNPVSNHPKSPANEQANSDSPTSHRSSTRTTGITSFSAASVHHGPTGRSGGTEAASYRTGCSLARPSRPRKPWAPLVHHPTKWTTDASRLQRAQLILALIKKSAIRGLDECNRAFFYFKGYLIGSGPDNHCWRADPRNQSDGLLQNLGIKITARHLGRIQGGNYTLRARTLQQLLNFDQVTVSDHELAEGMTFGLGEDLENRINELEILETKPFDFNVFVKRVGDCVRAASKKTSHSPRSIGSTSHLAQSPQTTTHLSNEEPSNAGRATSRPAGVAAVTDDGNGDQVDPINDADPEADELDYLASISALAIVDGELMASEIDEATVSLYTGIDPASVAALWEIPEDDSDEEEYVAPYPPPNRVFLEPVTKFIRKQVFIPRAQQQPNTSPYLFTRQFRHSSSALPPFILRSPWLQKTRCCSTRVHSKSSHQRAFLHRQLLSRPRKTFCVDINDINQIPLPVPFLH
ncbi:hypothetical protein KEM48_004462 [Puccinia striiformis f. sp. tritici PST-130]|nr:hypothetical protein KEM48_004462 [Puccinia striiformis f. sp. tritici PST-130]